ncbi:MAG: hypothetical protein PH343_05615 [Nitrospira sp.]|nr:hypothetical protein [Nitrospira sp.]
MQKIKCYLSHCISDGGILTEEIMQKNCQRAIDFGNFLRQQFPLLDVYIPAEHEDFVHKTYGGKLLTIPQILDIDCQILETKDIVIALTKNRKTSAGMDTEIEFAKGRDIPVFYCEDDRPFLTARMLEKFLFDRETLLNKRNEEAKNEQASE